MMFRHWTHAFAALVVVVSALSTISAPAAEATSPYTVRWTETPHALVSGTGATGGTAHFTIDGPSDYLGVNWWLTDAHGTDVSTDASWPTTASYFDPLTVSPEATAGHPIAPGSYDLTVMIRPSLTGSPILVHVPLEFVADPGPSTAPTPVTVSQDVHWLSWQQDGFTPAAWNVPRVGNDLTTPAILQIRDTRGSLVAESKEYAGCPLMTSCSLAFYGESIDYYQLGWSSGTDNNRGLPAKPGVYAARALIPGIHGEQLTVDLGTVRVFNPRLTEFLVDIPLTSAQIAPGRVIGRCSQIRVGHPTPRLRTLSLLSGTRCRSRAGKAGLAVQVFSVPLPRLSTIGTFYANVEVEAKGRGGVGHPRRGMDRTLDRLTVWSRVPSVSQSWTSPVAPRLGRKRSWIATSQLWLDSTDANGHYNVPDLSGRQMEVRLGVSSGDRIDLRHARLRIHHFEWSTTPEQSRSLT